jgi:cation transporter-like permease
MFNTPSDTLQVSGAIRDSVAPVLLLTVIGSFLGVIVNRLGRTIDRTRHLNGLNVEQRKKFINEFDIIQKRVTWMRLSIGLFIVSGLCILLSVALIFIGVAIKINVSNFILGTFIFAMFALILGIFCFLREIIYATQEVITWYRQD